jgi:hypothetical protein
MILINQLRCAIAHPASLNLIERSFLTHLRLMRPGMP